MDINEATAKSLQAARAVSGLTFAKLAEKSGVPAQTIYRMFGAKRDIKLPQLSAVAHAMGLTVVEIMQDAERIQMRSKRHSQDVADDAEERRWSLFFWGNRLCRISPIRRGRIEKGNYHEAVEAFGSDGVRVRVVCDACGLWWFRSVFVVGREVAAHVAGVDCTGVGRPGGAAGGP